MHSIAKSKKQRAFTLIETVISLSIMSVILLGLSSAMMIASRAIPTTTDTGAIDQQIIDAMNRVRAEFRMASGIAYRSSADYEQFTIDLKDSGAPGQTLLVRYRYDKANLTLLRMDTNYAEYTVLEDITGFSIDFTQENTDATLVHIILANTNSIQTMFEFHIALPDKPEMK